MKFERFKEIWNTLVTNRKSTKSKDIFPSIKISKHLEDELVKVADGKSSKFDKFNNENPN